MTRRKAESVRTYGDEGAPCQRCFALWVGGHLVAEMVQPIHAAPSIGLNGERQCSDCQSVETLLKMGMPIKVDLRAFVSGDARAAENYWTGFQMARVCVGNDRMEQIRLPGVPMGLVKMGLMRPSADGDFDRHMKWMNARLPKEQDESEEW